MGEDETRLKGGYITRTTSSASQPVDADTGPITEGRAALSSRISLARGPIRMPCTAEEIATSKRRPTTVSRLQNGRRGEAE